MNAVPCKPQALQGLDVILTGELTGVTPAGWTTTGWLLTLRDRVSRTDDPEMVDRFHVEIAAINAEIEAKRIQRKRKSESDQGGLLTDAAVLT